MLKAIGLIGLVLASGLVGVMKGQDLKRRIALIEDFLEMIIALKGQINYFREPLPQLFARLAKNQASKAFLLLGELGINLEEKSGEMVLLWPQQVEQAYKGEPITKEDMEIFKYLGEFVGQTDFENHLYHFSYLEEKLKKQIGLAKEIYGQKGPMYNKIGFFLGGIGAILLI